MMVEKLFHVGEKRRRKKLSCHLIGKTPTSEKQASQGDRARDDDQRVLEDLKNLLCSFHGVVIIAICLALF